MLQRKYLRLFHTCDELVGPILVGILVGWVSFGFMFILLDAMTFNMSAMTNIVIACASVIAVMVHCSSQHLQEKARRWELRKEVVFNLLKELAEVVKLNGDLFDLEMCLTHVNYDNEDEVRELPKHKEDSMATYKEWKAASVRMNRRVDDLLNVYKPILPTEILDSLDLFRENMGDLERLARQDWAEYSDLMCEEGKILKSLQTQLFDFVGKESGMR